MRINQKEVNAYFDALAEDEGDRIAEFLPEVKANISALGPVAAGYELIAYRYTAEVGKWREKQGIPRQKALAEWISGLAIGIAYYNAEILELAYRWGWENKAKTQRGKEVQEDKIINAWWQFSATQIMKRYRHYLKKPFGEGF